LPRQLEFAVQYVAEASDELSSGYILADASARHQYLRLRQLDWFSALDVNGISSARELMVEADPVFILGADIVRFSFRFYYHKLLTGHPKLGLRSVHHPTPHCYSPLGNFSQQVD